MKAERELDRLIEIASLLPDAIRERNATLRQLQAQLEDLNSTSCTGTIYWRDEGKDKLPKMYANHGVDQTCPIHGTPEPGKRLRSYVGTDPDKQAKAQTAIEREDQRRECQDQVNALERVFNRLNWLMRDLFRNLGYIYPSTDGALPQPDPEWSPSRAKWW